MAKPTPIVDIKTFKTWFDADKQHSAEWRKEAEEDFAFYAGKQWDEEDVRALEDNNRPVITMNRVLPVVNAVCGHEINNRHEIRYFPREQGDVEANEVLTEAARWFRDEANAEDEESDAFSDTVICGMGWTDQTMEFETNPDGDPDYERIDPLAMFWDHNAKKRNLADARRVWRIHKLSIDEAMEMFPGHSATALNNDWHDEREAGEPKDQTRERLYYDDGDGTHPDPDATVCIIEAQFYRREVFWRAVDPATGQEIRMSEDEYNVARERAAEAGIAFKAIKQYRRAYYQAYIGSEVIEDGPGKCKDKFTMQCITGYRDRNKGIWFGLIRAMKDPQRWANKWLSQALHIMNTNPKGGLMMEKGAVDDERQFEESYAKSDQISWVRTGALSGTHGQKFTEKPQATFPAGFYQLMEFAISSVPDVTGVNVEMMGLRQADQPASLEYQRRQSGLAIVAKLFDSLRQHRKANGEILLYYIKEYLADGRLVRIVGRENTQYVPLALKADETYDVIVDESASSPNQKEAVWSMIGEHFWNLPPKYQLLLLEYIPFPASLVQKVRKMSQEKDPQAEQDRQQAKEVAIGEAVARIKKMGSETEENKSQTALNYEKARSERIEADNFNAFE